MTRRDRPKWLEDFRNLLVRCGNGWLIYTERGPEGRQRLNGNAEGHVLIGWYTQRVSDDQLLHDAHAARIDAAIRGPGRPKGT